MLSIGAGCSADMMRFDDSLQDSIVTNSTITPNQHALIHKNGPSAQPLPPTTRDGIRVVSSAQPSRGLPTFETPNATTVASVTRSDLPQVTETRPVRDNTSQGIASARSKTAPVVLKARGTAPSPLRVLDTTTTASIAPPAPQQTAVPTAAVPSAGRGGWSAAGGSRVTLRSGETLYNLARRYGVPVKAIVRANGLASADAVQAGQTVTIPAYTQGEAARVSAPDSNPATKVARSSSGFQGQAVSSLTTPKRRADASRVAQTVAVATPNSHVITAGQTLYAVSRKYNVRLQALRDANGLTSDNVRIGQRLVIPGGEATAPSSRVDTTTTASVPKSQTVQQAVAVKKAAAQTTQTAKADASAFRWPLNGPVVTAFGAATATGANDGIDIAVPANSAIRAARSGTVIYSGSELEDFGNLVLLSHAGGYVTAYAHANTVLVKRGDKVASGQVIAKSGATGNAKQPKLHFEIRKNSKPVNPLTYLAN